MTTDSHPAELRIGELARRSGLTVRSLHHYDEIGLLTPDRRTASGQRLYSRTSVRRLYRIVALRGVGLSLAEVGAALDGDGRDLEAVLARHAEALEREIRDRTALLERVRAIAGSLATAREPSFEEYLHTIERTTAMNRHFTPEQLEALERRRDEVGAATITSVEDEWPRLYSAMRAEMDRGAAPGDDEPQRLAARMRELIAMFHGGDDGLREAQARAWHTTPREEMVAMLERQGVEDAEARIPTAELEEYCRRAHAVSGGC